ncbi:YEATS-associated helix-containing protein [Flammeovirga sp. SJP92]|uniref:YEATS-associated helix-containing protein n=1 Tax=Flammeovirga sp. SJP92 TaxID=1775430 RepID=UPI000786B9EC|nr:YEATS-associated helix-containing protein [Flammeovirga sp. SJP92]KXX67171.1 hypothetical protein AVL50_27675 [Flammeovirga sp. SJP92]
MQTQNPALQQFFFGSDLFYTILILIIVGIIGGIINYYHEFPSQEDKQQTLLQCLFLGVGASLMIPLFLKFTSFNFKPETATTEEFLELIGLCLIASIFARRFITSIGDKVLMEQLKKKISNIEEGVEEIVTEGYDEKSNEFKKEDFIEIDGNELAVLEAMKNKLPQKRRKVEGLMEDTSLCEQDAVSSLEALKKDGYVDHLIVNDMDRWEITKKGRNYFHFF